MTRSRLASCLSLLTLLAAFGCGSDIESARQDGGGSLDAGDRSDAVRPDGGAADAGADDARATDARGADAGGGGDGAAACVADDRDHTGEATYYVGADGTGNCSFDATPNDLMLGAMNHVDYAASAVCGACVRLTGPNATITIRIVDQCPECPEGDIDLSPEAFGLIAPLPDGRVPITWRYVSCDVQGPIRYHFKEGSNQWWSAVQIRNHRNRIATLEYRGSDGTYRNVPRLDYNYFVEETGMGPGPYAFRVTDVYGHVLEDTGVPFVEAGDSPGTGQFPPCGL